MIPASDIPSAVLVAALYLALFGTFELIGRRSTIDPELTRKGVHIGSGLIALTFPALFASHLSVLVLGILFGALLYTARRLHLLPSVHGVSRVTVGELLYPVAVYGSLLLSTRARTPHLYTICVLLLALADGLAGIVGTRVASATYRVPGGTKSLAGSLAFFVVALLSITSVLAANDASVGSPLLVALVTALLLTGVEAISTHGTDNVTVALGGWCVLMLTTARTTAQLAGDLVVLVVVATLLLSLLGRVRRIGVAGGIAASLVAFGAWMLVSPR
jgi:phytol kinase